LPDDVIDQILDSLDHQTVDWSETRPFFSSQQTAQLMYHAMGFGQGTQHTSSSLPQYTLDVWYNVTVDLAIPLSWAELADDIEGICREAFFAKDDEDIARGDVLDWFTMRLMQDISTNACDASICSPQASDEEIKRRILAIGQSMTGHPPGKVLSHIIKVARLLYRFHYPGLPPAHRDCGLFSHDDLIWLWRKPDELLQTYYHTPPTTRIDSYEARLQIHEQRPEMEFQCFLHCLKDIVMQQARSEHEDQVALNKSITDDFLMTSWRTYATALDFWSFTNLEPQNDNMLEHHHQMTWCSARVRRLLSRVTSRNITHWKQIFNIDVNGQWTGASSNNELEITQSSLDTSILVPLMLPFLWEQ
jgi:hypothetical protein